MSIFSFKSLLADTVDSREPFGYKYAQEFGGGIESPDEMQSEQDFSNLAYMFLQDRAPGLIKYLLGFEVVSREEDGSRSIGMFGFKIGKDYYYAPAFFLNNQIKGLNLLLSKRTNTFVPLQEDWINFIVNRQAIELGSGASAKDIQGDLEAPNFRFVSQPPTLSGGKIAEANDTLWSLSDAWDNMQTRVMDMLAKDAEFITAVEGAVNAITGDPQVKYAGDDGTALKLWFETHGGPNAVRTFFNTLTSNVKFASAALTFYPNVESLYVHEFEPSAMPVKSAAELTFITSEAGESDDLAQRAISDKDRNKIIRTGFTIVDNRKEEDKSDVYDVDYERMFYTPDVPGEYAILARNGTSIKGWVLERKLGYDDRGLHVVLAPDNVCITVKDSDVYVSDEKPGSLKELYDKSISMKDMEFDGVYLLINGKGQSYGPVKLESIIEEEGKRTRYKCHSSHNYSDTWKEDTGDFDSHFYGDRFRYEDGKLRTRYNSPSDTLELEIGSHKGDLTTRGVNTVVVPADWRALSVGKRARAYYGDILGTKADAAASLLKCAFVKLAIHSDDGRSFNIRVNENKMTDTLTYKQASIDLVTRLGLRPNDVDDLLIKSASLGSCRRLVKLAQMTPMVGVNMPMPGMPPAMGVDPYSGLPIQDMSMAQQVQGGLTGLPPPPDANQYGINIGGDTEQQIDPEVQSLADQAAQTGQRHIFDHASIGGLAKVFDTGDVLDSYVPELMKAMDRVGRILFLFYWNNADFAERFGTDDLAEMEDSLRNVFKSFGSLVLQLRKKSINSDDSPRIGA